MRGTTAATCASESDLRSRWGIRSGSFNVCTRVTTPRFDEKVPLRTNPKARGTVHDWLKAHEGVDLHAHEGRLARLRHQAWVGDHQGQVGAANDVGDERRRSARSWTKASLEDTTNVLHSGQVPHLLPQDEMDRIVADTRPVAKALDLIWVVCTRACSRRSARRGHRCM